MLPLLRAHAIHEHLLYCLHTFVDRSEAGSLVKSVLAILASLLRRSVMHPSKIFTAEADVAVVARCLRDHSSLNIVVELVVEVLGHLAGATGQYRTRTSLHGIRSPHWLTAQLRELVLLGGGLRELLALMGYRGQEPSLAEKCLTLLLNLITSNGKAWASEG